jgi:hypothetical protein
MIVIVMMVGKVQCGVGAAAWRDHGGGGTDILVSVAIHYCVDENAIGGGPAERD